ncbi:MAG: hypothetical protein A2Y10_03535 [Planctomycetes bacterium GWF2_41_51]|nr:MAG: hypothetical protein A2Y10_03535 [Planctomycetes bacterium GWF2_41_51]
MKEDKELSDLIAISNIVGCDKTLVQGGGGNTSVKTDNGSGMYIKASGTALGDMNFQKGWRKVKINKVKNIFEDSQLSEMDDFNRENRIVSYLLKACDDDIKENIRPSVEAPFHAILDKYVVHLHALSVLALVCAKGGKEVLEQTFSNQRNPILWIPYANPGYSLGIEIYKYVKDYVEKHGQLPNIIFLEKHGVIITSKSKGQILQLIKNVIDTLNNILTNQIAKDSLYNDFTKEHLNIRNSVETALYKITGQVCLLNQFIDNYIINFCRRKDATKLLKSPPMTPDEMGFVENIIWLNNYDFDSVKDKIEVAIKKNDKVPTTFMTREGGLLIRANKKLSVVIRDIVAGSLFVRVEAQKFGGINSLNSQQRKFIQNWEAEKFRVQLAAKGA